MPLQHNCENTSNGHAPVSAPMRTITVTLPERLVQGLEHLVDHFNNCDNQLDIHWDLTEVIDLACNKLCGDYEEDINRRLKGDKHANGGI